MTDIIGRFEDMLRFRGYTPDTAYRYLRIVEQFTASYPLTRDGVIGYINSLQDTSSTYRRWVMYVLKLLFLTERAEWPFSAREMPKLSPAKRPFLTLADFRRLLDISKRSPLDHALLRVDAVTGARRHELVKMRVADYNRAKKTLLVRTGKGGEPRVRALDDETCSVLDRYLDSRRYESDFLFISERGVPLSTTTLSKRFRKMAQRAGFDSGVGWHAVRRGMVTWLYRAGMRERELQEAMGWKSASMPHLYVQLVEGEVEKKVRALHPLFKDGR